MTKLWGFDDSVSRADDELLAGIVNAQINAAFPLSLQFIVPLFREIFGVKDTLTKFGQSFTEFSSSCTLVGSFAILADGELAG